MEKRDASIGRVVVSSVPMPDDVILLIGTYIYSGKVLVSYKTKKDIHTTDFYNLAVLNDDGTDFRVIFSGVIPQKPKANGIRYMPYQDHTRVLLGDYVLECTPDIDTCTNATLVPIAYPSILEEDERTTHHWSEIIIAPDNKHISWTILRSDLGAAVAIGVLERKTDHYAIENAQLINNIHSFEHDPTNPGFIIPCPLRGGEVKQFVRGGNAISIVGGKNNSTTDTIVQDLTSDKLTQITYTPGYDETTIFSPDERLGIVMSTRFSKNTDLAIFGLMPRPYGIYTSLGMISFQYMYAVDGVRKFRPGNIGPVLIDIQRSMHEAGYQGIQLTTDEENWVYSSPMSWHPDGKRVMWPEMVRGSDGTHMRLQTANLPDYKSEPAVPFTTTTDNIPYGIKDLTVLNSVNPNIEGKIAGKHSGYMNYTRNVTGYSGNTEAQFVNFSDDGENYYNGYEKNLYNAAEGCYYETAMQLTGSNQGEMNFRATFSALVGAEPVRLLFDIDADGKPKSYGYATYNGITLNIKDLLE
ncbi:hypothetical protein [Paenibacillus paridis]|uniref:hypothetical protein n=1 Tax=Paenibacillus paridis TaxID=2583376 RepID=UPI001122C017|nr:hypothetical protein [Paenibacillus paridis]